MEFIPVKARIMKPPQDSLWAVLDESLPTLKNEDVVLISSKVVAIHQGHCLPIATSDKDELVNKAADFIISREYSTQPLTVAHHAFLGAAGIDESNGDGHYILLPENIFCLC